MARTRVDELAKLLGVEGNRIAEILGTLGAGAVTQESLVSDEEARAVRAVLTREALIRHRRLEAAQRQSPAPDGKARTVQRARAAPAGQAFPAAPAAQKARSVISAESVRAQQQQQAELARAAAEKVVARPAPPPAPSVADAVPPPSREPRLAPATQPAPPPEAVQGPPGRPVPGAAPAGRREAVREPRPARVSAEAQPRDEGSRVAGGPSPSAGDQRRRSRGGGRAPARTGRPGAPRPAARPGAAVRRPARPAVRHRPTKVQTEAAARRAAPAGPAKVTISGPLTVKQLAEQAGVPMAGAVKQLMTMGIMATVNQTLDVDIAKRLAAELGAQVEETPKGETEPKPGKPEPKEHASRFMRSRPPVVTVMGHVDHGKTTLLDTIRKSRVAAHEAGGITQHIGASVVNWQGNRIVFIDTPGHEAFTAMRARGARVTDLVILVVAADDGVKPQTVEAISHIRAAKVPMIVAVNKVDRPGADPDRVKRQLSELGVTPEDWGGDTVFANVSALQGTGIDTLLEMVILVSEMQELKANPLAPGKGSVVEAQLDRSRGPVATVLIQTGTLRVGDAVVAGTASGRVRALFDFAGERLDQAGPSVPVEVLGLSEVPMAGDQFEVVEDDKVARERAARAGEERKTDQAMRPTVSLDDLYIKLKEGRTKDLNLVLKADVHGSLEALRSALGGLQLPEVRLTIVHGGVGPISESDVMLASTSDAIVIGFNVRPDPNARRIAQRERVQIREYEIIYAVLDDITAAAKGLLEPKMETVLIGKAQVRATFKVPRVGTIAGCYVVEGKITRNAAVKVVRDGRVVHEGALDSLKRFKDDVREVQAGYECGLGVAGFEDYVEGDVIEAYTTQRQEIEP